MCFLGYKNMVILLIMKPWFCSLHHVSLCIILSFVICAIPVTFIFLSNDQKKKFTLSLVEVLRHCFMAKSWITLPNSPADEKSFTVFWILPSQKYPCLKSYPFAGSFLIHRTNPFSDSIEKSQVNASFLFKICPSKGS